MRSLIALTMLFLLAVSVGCGSQSISGIPVRSVSTRRGCKETPPTTLDMEAAQQAIDQWKPTRLGESHYLCVIRPSLGMKTLYELRHVEMKVLPDSLSQADTLNGVEWNGRVCLQPESVRRYCPQTDKYSREPPDKTWSEWYTGNDFSDFVHGTEAANTAVSATKNNGNWKLSVSQDYSFKQVDPSDLPK